jgi:multidrug transporter EmrE-like cation transporter
LYIGIACTFLTGSLISYALRHLPAMTATIWGNLATVTSIIAGAVLLKEPLYTYQIVCTVLIITGVAGISYFTKPQNESPLVGGVTASVYATQKEQG